VIASGRNIKRRRFIKLTGAGILGSSILNPLKILGKSNNSEPIEIIFAFGPDDSGTYKKVIDRFNQKYQGMIHVNFREMARESDNYYRQLVSDFSVQSTEIDVFGADITWTAEFGRKGWVSDLTRRFFRDYNPDDFLEATLNSVSYRFKVWGVPWYTDAGMLFYRKDLLQKSGFSTPPRSWAELREVALKVKQDAGLRYGFVFQGAEYEGGVANALEFIWNAGGRVLTGNISVAGSFGQSVINPNVVTVNNLDSATGLDIARSLIIDGVAPESVTEFRELQTTQAFLSGNAVFMRGWPGVYGLIIDPRRSKILLNQVGVATLPNAEGNGRRYSCMGGWNLMINDEIENEKIDAAWTFIQFATASEQQRLMAMDGGFLPTLQQLYNNQEILDAVPVIKLGKAAIDNTRLRPVSPYYNQISLRISRTFNRVLKGELTGKEAVQKLEQELRTIIRRNR